MVMPRSRSRSMLSSSWLSISRADTALHFSSSRSASVDLPWSIWAMMEKFRMLLCFVIFGIYLLGQVHAARADARPSGLAQPKPCRQSGFIREVLHKSRDPACGGFVRTQCGVECGDIAAGRCSALHMRSPPVRQRSLPGPPLLMAGQRRVPRSTGSRSPRPRTCHSHSVPQIPASWRGSPPDFPPSGGPPPLWSMARISRQTPPEWWI